VIADAQAAYERREQEFGSEVMREVERRVILSVLDRKWREHLYEMDYLREGIGLRGYGQRDPLIEYQREGYDMFGAMMEGIKEESVGLLFNLEVQVQENPIVEEDGAVLPGGTAPAAVPTIGGAPGGGAPGGSAAPAQPARGRQPARGGVPAQGGGPAQGGVPAQGRPAGAHARGNAPAGAGDGRGGQGGRRDGRNSGGQGQSGRRDGRSSGAHARRTGSPAGGQNVSGGQGQDTPVPAAFAPRRPQRLQYSAPSVDGGTHVETSSGPGVRDDFAQVGRNDPCPCGSGRKYKRCHGDPRTRPDA
jgi:preprotein translocase subunit SecA